MAEFRERAAGYINIEEVREARKAEARTENGRVEDLRQSQKHEKMSQKRPESGPREKVKMKEGVTFTSVNLATMSIRLLMRRGRSFSKRSCSDNPTTT